MDSLIIAAARALSRGDPLEALKRVALREDPPALALRGTALAQLGDFSRARALLREAARGYGRREAVSRARCVVAEAEIALASRDLTGSIASLGAAREELEIYGDRANAAHARYLEIRRLVLIGRLKEAERVLSGLDPAALPPPLRASHELVVAAIAVRRVQAGVARSALIRAARAADKAGIPALTAEVDAAALALEAPAARLIAGGSERRVRLAEVEWLFASRALVVDACRYAVRQEGRAIRLGRRPVLFTLARMLAEAWPGDVPRARLASRAFRARVVDETYRARLRVEMGRLRRLLKPLAEVIATPEGFALAPRSAREVAVLAPLADDEHAAVLALLADGESWSSSGLALAAGSSARTVQRALEVLAAAGKVEAVGRGRARRWMVPVLPGIATPLLLSVPLVSD
jgi:hypothetical protein